MKSHQRAIKVDYVLKTTVLIERNTKAWIQVFLELLL